MARLNLPLLPPVRFRDGARGFDLCIGRGVIPQSTYLLAAAVLVGLGGGFGAIAFRALILAEQNLAFGIFVPHARMALGAVGLIAVVALGGALAAWVTDRFAPEAKGHGVPEVMAAVALRGGVMRPRIIGIKALASATSIAFGGSCGREGPIVQIGSAIGSVLGQMAHAPPSVGRTLVACGAAAGISATFNAPIAGVFFASEVILGDFAPRSFATIAVSSVVAAVVSRAYLGNRPSFSAGGFVLVSPRELLIYVVLGVVCALWAWAFVRILYLFEDFGDKWKISAPLKGAVGFAFVGAMGVFQPNVLGVGYEAIQHVLDSHVDISHALLLAVLKPIATSLTLAAGGSGGVFAPCLFTGAMLGDAFGRVVHQTFPTWTGPAAAYGLVAMSAVFAAAAEAPITAILIVFEMSYDYTIVLPLMISTAIASVLGRRLINGTVYELKLLRRGIDWKNVRKPHALASVTVAGVAKPPVVRAECAEAAASVLARLYEAGERTAVVFSGSQFLGLVNMFDLAAASGSSVGAVTSTSIEALKGSDTLDRAAALLTDEAVTLLPVVESDGTFLGVIDRREIIIAYRSAGNR